jgi:membrane-bound lytic murein transglycosylase D
MSWESYLIGRPKIFVIMILVIALLLGGVIFFRLPYISYTGEKIVFTPLNIDLTQVDFAGERVPMDPHVNPFGREKLENELLVTHLTLYQFLIYHKYARTYFPYIESYFHEISIPEDFKYLAVAESSLRNDAESHAGARGIWQLMPDTARRYGLRVDSEIDERLHFEKATRAAWAHLRNLNTIFENWTLAAAAYNRGESWLQRDQAAQPHAKTYYDLVLNNETGNYMYRIVAIKYLMQNRWKILSPEMLGQVFEVPETKTKIIDGPVLDLRIWCLENDIDYQELRELNPWILGYTLPGGAWEVKLFVR